ncbi:MAG: hypothetical protein AAFP90_10915 [Planctomycetota bacterium]
MTHLPEQSPEEWIDNPVTHDVFPNDNTVAPRVLSGRQVAPFAEWLQLQLDHLEERFSDFRSNRSVMKELRR